MEIAYLGREPSYLIHHVRVSWSKSTIHVSRKFAHDLGSMPNLYFCQPHAKNQGMLRAVLSVNECEAVIKQHLATYVGEDFPRLDKDPATAADFARMLPACWFGPFGSGPWSGRHDS